MFLIKFQAPSSMKTVVQALYWLTFALGNVIDIVIMSILLPKFGIRKFSEIIIFAIIMLLDMIALYFVSTQYKYKEERIHKNDFMENSSIKSFKSQ